ncbi:MAG: 30S ribosomal protein S12 methylthiotransferase RimO [Candidatus Omnitrophota bacterium]
MKPDIFIISLGCPRNLVDCEVLVGKLKKHKHRVSYKIKDGCIGIVNTCGFTLDAKNESIDVILELAGLKREGRIKKIIVTGCLSQRYSKKLMKEVKEIDAIFGSSTFTEIPEYVDRILRGEKIVLIEKMPLFLYDHDMPRSTMTPKHTVYVKIQEGCMNFCSYCVIPRIRGPFRSRSIESVLEEITRLKASGAKEINLVGQDTTLFGMDTHKKYMLHELLMKASKIMKDGWVRLLYTHPAHYSQALIDTIKTVPEICKYVDLPIQHISDKILKKMARATTKKSIMALIKKLKSNIPDLAIRTSVIVGFPGETDKDFNELVNFIKEIEFDRLGAFVYSREEGTPAYDFKGQIPEDIKRLRFGRIMEIQKDISEKKNNLLLGKKLKILIDKKCVDKREYYVGRTQHDAPEVDGEVYIKTEKKLKAGAFLDAKIIGTMEYDLVGEI